MNIAQNSRKLYLVKKLTGTSSSYNFGYLRQKHFRLNSYKMYVMRRPTLTAYTMSVDFSNWHYANRV